MSDVKCVISGCGRLGAGIFGGNFYCSIHDPSRNRPPPQALIAKFDAALAATINADRAVIYGHPLDNFGRIAAGAKVIEDCSDPEVRVALNAIWTKVCRLVQSPEHFDSVLDIAGYARTIVMILDKRAEK
jgi:uncharacterized protein DUF6378